MTEPKKNRWVQEYESLPEWLRKFIDAFREVRGYGIDYQPIGGCKDHIRLFVSIHHKASDALFPAVIEMKKFCDALSAPAEHEVGVDYGILYKCQYAELVEGGVLCHCEAWPDKHHDCTRTWDRPEHRMKACPGFAPNHNYKEGGL